MAVCVILSVINHDNVGDRTITEGIMECPLCREVKLPLGNSAFVWITKKDTLVAWCDFSLAVMHEDYILLRRKL